MGIITAAVVLVLLLVIFVAVVLLCKSKFDNHTMYHAHWSIQSDDLDDGRMLTMQENKEAPKTRKKAQVQCHWRQTLGKVRQN